MNRHRLWMYALGAVTAVLVMPGEGGATLIGTTGSFDWVRQSGHYEGNGGGFTIHDYGNALTNEHYADGLSANIGSYDPSFQTFCLEESEYAEWSSAQPTYFVIGGAAVLGGLGSVDGSDPLSKGTAWLYSEFAKGTLGAYGYVYGSSASAGALQKAIWAFEGEPSGVQNSLYAAAVNHFDGMSMNALDEASAGYLGVYVMNNFDTQADLDAYLGGTPAADIEGRAQDFLYFHVPDGGLTLLMLGLSLTGLGMFNRARRRT